MIILMMMIVGGILLTIRLCDFQSVLDVQRAHNICIMVAKLGKTSFFDLAKVIMMIVIVNDNDDDIFVHISSSL